MLSTFVGFFLFGESLRYISSRNPNVKLSEWLKKSITVLMFGPESYSSASNRNPNNPLELSLYGVGSPDGFCLCSQLINLFHVRYIYV